MLSVIPNRAYFNVTYSEILELPVRIRDRMVEKINEWRAQEDANARKKGKS